MSSFTCTLDKRSRGRSSFAFGHNWKSRSILIQAQELSYYDGNTKKGSLNLAKCNAEIIKESDADGKPFPFELQVEKESVLFSAPTADLRDHVLSILKLASKSANWVDPRAVNTEFKPINVTEETAKLEQVNIDNTLNSTVSEFSALSSKKKLKNALAAKNLAEAREHAACMIQASYRAKMARRTANHAKTAKLEMQKKNSSASTIQAAFRNAQATATDRSIVYHHPVLLKVHIDSLNLTNPSGKYQVVVSGIASNLNEEDASEDNKISAGACTTTDITEALDCGNTDAWCRVGGVNIEGFVAIAVIRDGSRGEFIGQGHISLKKLERLWKGQTKTFTVPLGKAKSVMRKESGMYFEVGQEAQDSGSVTVTLSIPNRAFNMAGPVTKLTETLVSSNFKRRYFILDNGVLTYYGSPYSLSGVKHTIICAEVTMMVEERHKSDKCIRISFIHEGAADFWLIRWDPEDSSKYVLEWNRKLLRNCKKLPNSDHKNMF